MESAADAIINYILEDDAKTRARKRGRKAIPALYVPSPNRAVIFCKRQHGLRSKAAQLSGRTGSNILLLIQQVPTDGIMNNYVYADSTWRTSLFSGPMRVLLSEQHGLRDANTSPVYAPVDDYQQPFSHVLGSSIETFQLVDMDDKTGTVRSQSQDSYCRITYGPRMKRSRSRNGMSAPQAGFFCDDIPEDEEEAVDYEAVQRELENILARAADPTTAEPDASPKVKKRGSVLSDYVQDTRKRGQTFTKRLEGIMNKIFEITALTGCHTLLVISAPALAPPGLIEGTPVPSAYHVFASPVWRRSVAFVPLMRLLRLAQETDHWAPKFFPDGTEDIPPVHRFVHAMGYPQEFQLALQQSDLFAGYMFSPYATTIKMHPIHLGSDRPRDYSASFKWKTNILPAFLGAAAARRAKRALAESEGGIHRRKPCVAESHQHREFSAGGSPVARIPLAVSADCVPLAIPASSVSSSCSTITEDVVSACGSVSRLASNSDLDGDRLLEEEAAAVASERPQKTLPEHVVVELPPVLPAMLSLSKPKRARERKFSSRGDLLLL